MRRRGAAGLAVFAATASCGVILGLEPPPDTNGIAPDAEPDVLADAVVDAGAPVCAALDAGDGGAVYTQFDQVAIDDAGTMSWTFFSSALVPNFNSSPGFVGGAFDGRYVYFPTQSRYVVRYDTSGGAFTNPSAWSRTIFNDTSIGFDGAVFDGRYVTFVPGMRSGSTTAVAARFDTHAPGDFQAVGSSSWEYFDVAGLSDGGASTLGFYGGVFDGRYVHFVPHDDGAPFGRVVRFDTVPTDAGVLDGGDAGDAGVPGVFANPAAWTVFDVAALDPAAQGFMGGIFTGDAVHFVPNRNGVFDSGANSGWSGTVARYGVRTPFGSATSWSTFDTTRVSGQAYRYLGGAFDGRYAYFAPHTTGIVLRYDTSGPFGSPGAWAPYDTRRTISVDGGSPVGFSGAAYDGRFVYFVPSDSDGVSPVVRYDTLSTFTADCAWSSFAPAAVAPGGAGVPAAFAGAVFDGQFLYLPPSTSTKGAFFVRFAAKTPSSMPNLPAFYGSFL
jgi:hypothetical protein